ncbi:MAG TPA: metallophosphoesterase [bacterium]|nr:metallophosphoesterase [bacterium]
MMTVTIIFFLLHLAANAWLVWNFFALIRPRGKGRLLFWAAAAVAVLAYPLPRVASGVLGPDLSLFLASLGAAWYGYVWYLSLAFVVLRLGLLGARVLGRTWTPGPGLGRRLAAVLFLAVTLLLAAGARNAARVRITEQRVALAPGCGPLRRVRIAAVSDIHLGLLVGPAHLCRIAAAVKSVHPDLVVIIGDTLDSHIRIDNSDEFRRVLSRIRAPLGVYAVLGNHEYLSGAEAARAFLESCGIRVLRDQAVLVADSFYLAGRDDYARGWFGFDRTPLAAVLEGTDPACPVVLLDHQPAESRVAEAASAGVGLMLSGHIHRGQLSPFECLVGLFFPYIYGEYRVGEMTLLVTSGAGYWGPPVRIGNRPEVMLVTVEFGQE